VEKTNQLYVLPRLLESYTTTVSFDLWMNKEVHDVFGLVVIFWGSN
jgi:hypothetical protein